MNRRGFFKRFAAAIAGTAVASALPVHKQLRVFNIGERDGWRLKIALEPGRVIVAHDGPTFNGRTYPWEAWSEAVGRGPVAIHLDGVSLPVGQACDLRIDVLRGGDYAVSCVPILMPRYARLMTEHRRAGNPVFLTPSGVGQIDGGLVKEYKLENFELNHDSGFKHASPL